jgi:hypothetical protein
MKNLIDLMMSRVPTAKVSRVLARLITTGTIAIKRKRQSSVSSTSSMRL